MRWPIVALTCLVSACVMQQPRPAPVSESGAREPAVGPSSVQPELAEGLRQYEEGDYRRAQRSLESSLEHGLSQIDEISARKHLAFIHCMAAREKLCREQFRRVLALNPNFELAQAEAGHPQWGPVFRQVKDRP